MALANARRLWMTGQGGRKASNGAGLGGSVSAQLAPAPSRGVGCRWSATEEFSGSGLNRMQEELTSLASMRGGSAIDWNAPISVSELNLLTRQLVERNIGLLWVG